MHSNCLKDKSAEDWFKKCDSSWYDWLKYFADEGLRDEISHSKNDAHEKKTTELCSREESHPSPKGIMLNKIASCKKIAAHSHVYGGECEHKSHREKLWIHFPRLSLMT